MIIYLYKLSSYHSLFMRTEPNSESTLSTSLSVESMSSKNFPQKNDFSGFNVDFESKHSPSDEAGLYQASIGKVKKQTKGIIGTPTLKSRKSEGISRNVNSKPKMSSEKKDTDEEEIFVREKKI